MLHVADDPDDRDANLEVGHPDSFADRILAGPHRPRERLIDDGDRRRLQIVAVGEIASLQQRNLHRAEVVRRHDVLTRPRLRAGGNRPAVDREWRVAPVAAVRDPAHERGRFDARRASNALDGLPKEPRDVGRAAVLRLRQPELQRQHVGRIEAAVDALQREHRLHQQA